MQRLARVARTAAVAAPRTTGMQVRRMGGGGHDDHHPHLMWDTTTPWNPMGAPLAILTGIVVGGLGTIAFAISFSQSQFLRK